MPRPRTSSVDLVNVLNASDAPMYVLDEDRTVVFCNKACERWTGLRAEQLVGRRCAYHSEAIDAANEAAAGLCPPPNVFGASTPQRAIVSTLAADGRLLRRFGDFVPLADKAGGVTAVLAIIDTCEMAEHERDNSPVTTGDASAQDLHERLRVFRHRFARRHSLDRMVGDGPAIARVRAQVLLAAQGRANVLIVGAAGCGKEFVARAIHIERDPTEQATFVPLACAVLAPELLLSTLRALNARNVARGVGRPDTVLLNNVDTIAPEAQAELASLLRSGSLTLNVLSTASKTLSSAAAQGEFRYDLACELSTLVIELPALSERLADLPLIAQMFLEDVNASGDKQLTGISPEALDLLAGYPWPGNINELAAMIREAHDRAEAAVIRPVDLPDRIRIARDARRRPKTQEPIDLEKFLAKVEQTLIERALRQAKGNKSRAARLLGMTRPRLYRRLVQMGLLADESLG